MTYVSDMNSEELTAHMVRLQATPGWHNPLDDRLWQEVQWLRVELEAARGLLRRASLILGSQGYGAWDSLAAEIEVLLTATPAPEVPDHLREPAKMVEQGDRQEAQVMGRVHYNPDHPEPVRAVLNSIGRTLPDNAPLYTAPQPGQDVRGLVEALERIADAGESPTLGDPNVLRAIAAQALTDHRQAQQGEQP